MSEPGAAPRTGDSGVDLALQDLERVVRGGADGGDQADSKRAGSESADMQLDEGQIDERIAAAESTHEALRARLSDAGGG